MASRVCPHRMRMRRACWPWDVGTGGSRTACIIVVMSHCRKMPPRYGVGMHHRCWRRSILWCVGCVDARGSATWQQYSGSAPAGSISGSTSSGCEGTPHQHGLCNSPIRFGRRQELTCRVNLLWVCYDSVCETAIPRAPQEVPVNPTTDVPPAEHLITTMRDRMTALTRTLS